MLHLLEGNLMKNLMMMVCALGFAVGCGGGGGGNKKLSELSDAEAKSLCEYANDHLYPATTCTVDGMEIMIDAQDPIDCSTASANDIPDTCTATEDDYEGCIDAIQADPCVLLGDTPPAACAPLFSESCQSPQARVIRSWFTSIVTH